MQQFTFLLRAAAAAVCVLVPAAAQNLSPAEILARVSHTYQNLKSFDATAQQQTQLTGGGMAQSGEAQITFAMAPGGKFYVAMKASDRDYIMTSDGENTWRYSPKTKQWSKETASAESSDDDEDSAEDSKQASDEHDPVSDARRLLVDRYAHLDRLATAARLDRDDKVKIDGDKIECYRLILTLPNQAHELTIDKQRFLVLRQVEVRKRLVSNIPVEQRTTTLLKHLDTSAAPDSRFVFTPPPKTTEVSMLILPGEDRPNLTGKAAADFTLKDLQGDKVSLSDLRGKVVMLDFWATWCPPCRRELPTVAKLRASLKDKNVAILGVNDEESSTVKSYLRKHELEFPVLMDSKREVHKLYGARAIPTVVIIKPSGEIAAYYVGERSEAELVEALKGAGLEL